MPRGPTARNRHSAIAGTLTATVPAAALCNSAPMSVVSSTPRTAIAPIWRGFHFFCLAEDQIRKEGLEGDIAELGVYRGNTAIVLATAARRLGRTLYLLDTFEGFPERDLTGIDADKPMGFGDTSLESVRARVGDDHVRFIKGYFPDTAADLAVDARYCLVHIDCDLYAPAKSALSYFYPRLVPGGFLVVHDYSSLSLERSRTSGR